MRDWISSLLMFVLLVLAPVGSKAFAQLSQPGQNNISARLVAEGPAMPGRTVTLAIVMSPKPDWHGYWQNPGDAGIGMSAEWSLPAGASVGPLRYPVPDRLMIAGLMNYVYKGDYALLVDLLIPQEAKPGSRLPVRAELDYLACTDEICVPERATVSADIPVAAQAGPRSASFDRYREALPKPLGSEARFAFAGGKFRMAIPLPKGLPLRDVHFFPATENVLAYSAVQTFAANGDELLLEVEAPKSPAAPASIEGVLKLEGSNGLWVVARPGAVPPLPNPSMFSSASAASGAPAILAALLGALLGGLLLNIMPCVFPILSLKALSLAKVGGDEAAVRREATAYTAGIVLICLGLGALLLLLRAGGAAIGWAFQLQDPRVILTLLLLVTAIGLNLAGLFELPALSGGDRLARRGGTSGAFWTGALAAFIATPCTGPFMGAALGAALVLPTAAALAVFAGLGLGLALPFLLLGFVPPLRRRLPKPGPWMARFRRLMSVPMFLTAIALAWILGRQSGIAGMTLGISAALILALALWWIGRKRGEGRLWLPLAPAAAAAAAALFLVPTAMEPAVAKAQGRLAAEPFSEERLAMLRAEGRPVFVYFTADWCVTCKVNEKAALEQEEVAREFARRNVEVLVGDWTRGDSEIGRFLDSHGRSGVPLYLYYAPGKPAEILPQVLTTGRLIETVG